MRSKSIERLLSISVMINFCEELLVLFLCQCALGLPMLHSTHAPSALEVSLKAAPGLFKKDDSPKANQCSVWKFMGLNVYLALFQFCRHKMKMHKMSCQQHPQFSAAWSGYEPGPSCQTQDVFILLPSFLGSKGSSKKRKIKSLHWSLGK